MKLASGITAKIISYEILVQKQGGGPRIATTRLKLREARAAAQKVAEGLPRGERSLFTVVIRRRTIEVVEALQP